MRRKIYQATKMTPKQWHDRAEAFEEAAAHLEQSWTDDPSEREQGQYVSAWARKESMNCARKAEHAAIRESRRESKRSVNTGAHK